MEPGLLVERMLEEATLRRASDIHLRPKEDSATIMFRVDGYLIEWFKLRSDTLQAAISRLKYISQMDIGEKRFPQDGSLMQIIRDQIIQLRLSTIPTIHGEKLVIRLFPQQQEHLSLTKLGFSSRQRQHVLRMIQSTHGLLLMTGPTGSGKTTTMYRLLEQLLHNTGLNICSLEDPVEMRIENMTQVQIQPQQGFTFARGLRAMLRQDPDVIFVGEIRDEETAEIAIRAALTGHFVLSTLHTADAVGAIARLLQMNIKPYYIASALKGVINQRLFRRVCPYCQDGCYACFFTGYLGRQGVYELLPIDTKLRNVIMQAADGQRLQEVANSLNEPTIYDMLMRHVATGLTSPKESLAFLNME